jgi:hypothetical protein
MSTSLVCALHHARSVRDDQTAIERAAEILTRPCFAALRRAAIRVGDREMQDQASGPTVLAEMLSDPKAHAVVLDSGRSGELIAKAVMEVGLSYKPDADIPAPMTSYVVVPYDAASSDAALDAFCELAGLVSAAHGMVSAEPSYATAHAAALAGKPAEEDRERYRAMTENRIRYRKAPVFHRKKIDVGIGGPEWGTCLGPKHVAQLSLETLRASGAFFEVRELSYGGAFLRLTKDPMDAQSDRIVELVERARAALAPIALDVSDVNV